MEKSLTHLSPAQNGPAEPSPENPAIAPLIRFRARWRRLLLLESLGLLLLAVVLALLLSPWLPLGLALPLSLLLFGGIWYGWRRPQDVSLAQVADYLNRQHAQLQDSTELLLQPTHTLPPMQQWQAHRVQAHLSQCVAATPIPHQLRKLLPFLLCVVLITLTAPFIPAMAPTPTLSAGLPLVEDREAAAPLPAGLASLTIALQPPAYMRQPAAQQSTLPLSTWAGTRARWSVAFTQPVQRAALVWGSGDTLALAQAEGLYTASRILSQNTFYALAWQDAAGTWQRTDYAPVEAQPDAAPAVAITNREPYVKLDYAPNLRVEVALEYTDDFDLTESTVVATVARGSGEGVKFRESRWPVAHNWAAVRPRERVTLHLALDSLEMTPGDELYFYVEVYDNRQPERQRSRTEMYFVALRDTANNVIQMEGGLGVDLMPDYFRSQRQLIIDTEKLIADRQAGKVTEQEFKALSNELGYDQKALRLKYGALLGLEDEEAGTVPADFAPEATMQGYLQHAENEEFRDDSHEHGEMDDDHAEEQSGSIFSRLVAEGFGNVEADHDHDHGGDPNASGNPLDAFVHAHDDSEEATFYAQGLKVKLRHALDQMWDAELYLRLYTPAESLPYQYEALEMINDIRLDARIYVERVGFEPPPLKVPEVRLTGDQNEIQNVDRRRRLAEAEAYPALRRALPVLERLRTRPGPVTAAEQLLLGRAGQTLAAVALQQPGSQLLTALSQLKNLEEGTLAGSPQAAAAAQVEAAILLLFPPAQARVTGQPFTLTPLQQQWRQTMEGGTP